MINSMDNADKGAPERERKKETEIMQNIISPIDENRDHVFHQQFMKLRKWLPQIYSYFAAFN
jgi:hypothetical protein